VGFSKMSSVTFVEYLSRYTAADWANTIETLAPEIHPIDLDATRIWLAFHPEGPAAARIDSSHAFLYGHRYWPQVKRAVLAAAKDSAWPSTLAELVDRVADHATRTTQVDRDQLLGVTAASLVTLRHRGIDSFVASSGSVQLPHRAHVRSIRQVRRARARQRWRPLAALFGGRRFRMTLTEGARDGFFEVRQGATVAEGMPGSLRLCSANCSGACAIGILSGAEYLSDVGETELELLRQANLASLTTATGYPLIRLACHARPLGDVSLVTRPRT
jgi:hypothetical protein